MEKSSLRQGMDHGKLLLLTDLFLTPIPNADYAGNGKNTGNFNMDKLQKAFDQVRTMYSNEHKEHVYNSIYFANLEWFENYERHPSRFGSKHYYFTQRIHQYFQKLKRYDNNI